MVEISRLNFENVREGDVASFEEILTEKMIDDFALVSGDFSTLHVHNDFAEARGFRGRVAHGVLLASFLSRMVGMHLPGENALLLAMNVKFSAPAYVGDRINVHATVDQVSESTRVVVLKILIKNMASQEHLVTGKIHVGFTRPKE
jgi:acyl dehydratase